MKKVIFTLSIVVLAWFAMAQTTVPNGAFENWTSGKPDNWTTSISGNILVEVPVIGNIPYPVSVNFGSQTTDAHGGNSALKLMASEFGVPSTEYNFLIPGVAQLGSSGEFNVPLSAILELVNGGLDSLDLDNLEDFASLLNVVSPGMPCESTPYDLKMWVKYLPQGGDTMRVIAFSKQDGVPISYANYETTQTMSDYTQISMTFDSPYAACDSICVIIFAGGMATNPATELYVDDVEFDYHVGVADHPDLKVNIYPNPATNQFRIDPTVQDPYMYKLMDLTGRCVASGHHVSGATDVDVRALAPGVYMLFLEQKGHTLTKKVVVR